MNSAHNYGSYGNETNKKEVFSLETKNDFSDFRTQEMAAAISILCIHIQQKGTMTKDELLKKDDAKETI